MKLEDGILAHKIGDRKKAFECFEKHAEINNKVAKYWLGYYYWEGYVVDKNLEDFVKYLTMAANNGNSAAQFNLGDLYFNGKLGISKDEEKGLSYLKLAAIKGQPKAHAQLRYAFSAINKEKINIKGFLKFLKMSANEGNALALFNLGDVYLNGKFGIEKDENLGIKYLKKQIRPKNLFEIFARNQLRTANYYFIIGFMSEHAFGKEKDPQMAFEYYYKAADLGDPRGLVYVGWCYYKGMGTSKDAQKAFTCFQRAANNGCISAHNNVGWCYDIGFGTSSDPYKAFECFKSSAEKGYATAQCRVGVCYEYGRGTPKDLEKALEWYTKAAENGHETAKRRVSELTKLIRRGHRRRSFLVRILFT
uniref:HCP-like protein n=1 Tax=Rhizophagus irregularis (strain DAOM 181602 / DAOM 197198 / MUCL 43194) TaxID=747089 RepID=U9UUE1_RHIID